MPPPINSKHRQPTLVRDIQRERSTRQRTDQNLVLPWVLELSSQDLWQDASASRFGDTQRRHLLTDMIACPGGDYCALANARSIAHRSRDH
jgi:sulfite reductase beta subunit-like hemoprotein